MPSVYWNFLLITAPISWGDYTTTRDYQYEDPHDRHNLTGITDERGICYASWGYDSEDRAILSEHAKGVDKVTLDFSQADKTRVTDS